MILALLASVSAANSQPASARSEEYQYSLVVGRIVKGQNEEGECAGNDEGGDLECWQSVNRATLSVHRRLGGEKATGRLNMVYVSHARIRDDVTLVYLLKKRPTDKRFVLERLYSEKSRGRSCMTQEQIDEVSSFGIKTAKPVRLCPVEED